MNTAQPTLDQRLTIVVSALERLADACGFCADSGDAEYFRNILWDLKQDLHNANSPD